MPNLHHLFRSLITATAITLLTAPAFAGKPVVGREFPNFTAKDPITGKKFALKDLRGKVVLIDFWATWCGPCVAEIPEVKKVYKKYHDQGFEIISISLDQSKSKFKRYVKSKKMKWIHVMDGGAWKTRLAKKYGINSIPAMFIVDHAGVIISDSARGKALEKIVKKALGDLPENPSAGASDGYSESGNLNSKQLRHLTRRLDAVRRKLDEVAAPFQSLINKLDQIEDLVIELKADLPNPALTRQWEALRQTLIEIRGSLFAHGVLDINEAALPPDPFGTESSSPEPDPTAYSDYLERMRQLQSTLRRDANQATMRLRDLFAQLNNQKTLVQEGREAYASLRAEGKILQQAAEQLLPQVRNAWQDQVRYADDYLALLQGMKPASSDQPLRGEAFLVRINECRSMLRAAARERKTLLKLRDDFDALCRDLQVWADEPRREDAEAPDEPVLLPTNPLARVLKLDSRTRIKMEKQLERAEKAVARLRQLTAGVDASLVRLQKIIADLRTKLRVMDDNPSVKLHLEERFQSFCRDFLEEWDRATFDKNE